MRKLLLALMVLAGLCGQAEASLAQVRDVYPEAERLFMENRFAESVSLCLEGLAQPELPEFSAVELYSILGAAYARLNAFEKAAEYMKKCYDYDLANGEKKGLTSSLINLASMYVYAGEPEKGEAYALEAIANEKGVGRPDYMAKAYGKACDVYHALGQDEAALEYADLAVEVASRELNDVQTAIRRSQRAYPLSGLGRHEEALSELAAAEKVFRDADVRQSLSVVRFQQAQEYGALNDIPNEIECLQEAQMIASQISDIPLLQKIAKYETDRREETVGLQNQLLDQDRRVRRTLIALLIILFIASAVVTAFAIKVRRSERRLKETNDQKDFLFKVISHDLRSPAVAQLTGIQMLRRRADKLKPEDFSGVLAQMELQAGAEVELIENALKWSKLRGSADGQEAVRFNLADLARETTVQYKQPADIKEVVLEIDAPSDVFVSTNRSSLALVLRNLLSNAIKFSNKGGTVRLSIEERENEAVLSVADNGVGIPPEDLAHIFDPASNYRRTGTAGEPSNGLGLAVSRALIEEIGGSLEAVSTPGEGSTFIIRLLNDRA